MRKLIKWTALFMFWLGIGLKKRLKEMLKSDRPTRPVDILIYFGHVPPAHLRLKNLALELWKNGLFKTIIVNGIEDEKKCGHTKTQLLQDLKESGIDQRDFFRASPNTPKEALAIIEYAKTHGLTTATILADPERAYRCFMDLLWAMKVLGYKIDVCTATPTTIDWFKRESGSKNKNEMEKHNQIEAENLTFKIQWFLYMVFRKAPTKREAFRYLRKRGPM